MEFLSSHSTPDLQVELVRRYCGDVEAMIEAATTVEDAKQIGEHVCGKLERECGSPLVSNAARVYVENIIRQLWRLEE